MVTEKSRGKKSLKRPPRLTLSALRQMKPPKSVEQLAREQGIDLDAPAPDYVALAAAVWPTKKDADEAIRLLRDIRNKKPR